MIDRDVTINPTLQLIEIQLTGLVDGDALNWGIGQIEHACRAGTIRRVVWDLRKADLSLVTLHTLRGTVEDWPSKTLHEAARIAVVAGSEADKLLLQLWREAGRHQDTRERDVFLDIDLARTWTLPEKS